MEYRRVPINGQALVVTFDMCSSSTVIEELTKACDVQRLSAFITELKRHLAELQRVTPFDPYKFTGDGWILLFPAETPGPGLLAVLEGVCTFFADRFPRSVLSYLPHRPKSIGLTFGIDKGELIAMKMFKQPEYVGRAINIACRLQSAVGAKGRPPAYNALVTNRVFNEYFADLKLVRVDRGQENIAQHQQWLHVPLPTNLVDAFWFTQCALTTCRSRWCRLGATALRAPRARRRG